MEQKRLDQVLHLEFAEIALSLLDVLNVFDPSRRRFARVAAGLACRVTSRMPVRYRASCHCCDARSPWFTSLEEARGWREPNGWFVRDLGRPNETEACPVCRPRGET